MLDVVLSNAFKKDLKNIHKRGYPLDHLRKVVDLLASCQPLPAKYRDHCLSGTYSGFRECHIEPDWLLIYRTEDDTLVLFLFRTGTHSDLL